MMVGVINVQLKIWPIGSDTQEVMKLGEYKKSKFNELTTFEKRLSNSGDVTIVDILESAKAKKYFKITYYVKCRPQNESDINYWENLFRMVLRSVVVN
jgi:hypothetical protein